MTYLPDKALAWRNEVSPLGPASDPSLATPMDAAAMSDLEDRIETGLESAANNIPATVVSVSSPGTNTSPEWNGSAYVAVEHMKAERTATAYTIYVDHQNGSDANDGKSPGRAVQTLTQAALILQLANQRGQITYIEGGTANINAPVHFPQGAVIRCLGQSIMILQRNFTTPNGRSVWDAVTTASGTSVSSATAAFTNADNGRIVSIYGAGVQGGTYYDFISGNPPSGTVANLTATTTIARNATTDYKGVKMSIVGDWNRVVTDASITSGQSVITSATAAWTTADVNTEIVIAGAGHAGQALRSVIASVSGNTATIIGVAQNTVTSQRCAIGVIFGDLITSHAGGLGIRNAVIQDTSSGQNSIGSAIKLMVDEGAAVNSDDWFEHVRVTSTDTAGAWEHILDVDGSWQQTAGGPGVRRVTWEGMFCFGARRPAETIRMNGAVHHYFTLGGIFAAPTTIQQGITLLDPRKTGGDGTYQAVDIHFADFEAEADYYAEGQFCTFFGGRLGSGASSVFTATLAATSDNIIVDTCNGGGSNAADIGGTNSGVKLSNTVYMKRDGAGTSQLRWIAAAENGVTGSTGVGAFLALTGSLAEFGTFNNAPLELLANNLVGLTVKPSQAVVAGKSAPATNATDGFLYIPVCAGAPTGTPVANTGFVPIVYDSTNHKIWIFDTAWKGVVVS